MSRLFWWRDVTQETKQSNSVWANLDINIKNHTCTFVQKNVFRFLLRLLFAYFEPDNFIHFPPIFLPRSHLPTSHSIPPPAPPFPSSDFPPTPFPNLTPWMFKGIGHELAKHLDALGFQVDSYLSICMYGYQSAYLYLLYIYIFL